MRGLAVLLVIGVIACGDDAGDPVGDTGASTTMTTSTTTIGETSDSEDGSGTDASSGAADSSSTADEPQVLPMCAPANDQAMCESTFGCVWDHTPGQCVVACDIIEDEAVCVDHDCEWDGQACAGMPN